MGAIATVNLRDFDRGVIESLGSELISFQVDGAMRQAYALDVPGLRPNIEYYGPYVPVFFATPEDVFQPYRIPCVVVRRNDLRAAFERSPFYGYQRTAAPDARVVRVPAGDKVLTGSSKYVTAALPVPFDIGYDLQVYARTQNTGITLLTRVLQTCRPPYFSVAIYDSLGDRRLYDAGEVNIASNSELADIADRTIAWTISFDVRGELDLEAQHTEESIVTSLPNIRVQVTTQVLNLSVNARLNVNTRVMR